MDAKRTPGKCPGCGTQMVNCGAPIWEDYCPNKSCTHQRDEMFASLRAQRQAMEREKVLRDAAPMLLDAAMDCLKAFKLLRLGMAGDSKAVEMIDAHISELEYAIAKARGEA